MKKILLGFIAIGLLTFVGCKKDDDTETSSDDGTTETSSVEAKDADGNTYKTVTIGEQEWFAENLKTSKYNDGTDIPNVTGNTEWYNLSTGAWCNYDNSSTNDVTYGKLYNWHAVNTSKLCPTGWHVPTDAEWTVLEDYLTANGHSETEAQALKATSGWGSGTGWGGGNGTDDYGWSGLPGGYRYYYDGNFGAIGYSGNWWSSSQYSAYYAWYRFLVDSSDGVNGDVGSKTFGFSVRCLMD